MAPCVADTSWLLALLDKDDPANGRAAAEASRMDRIHVPPVILAETLSWLHGRATTEKQKREATERQRRAVAFLASKANMVLAEPPHDHETTVRHWEGHPKLSYHDAAAAVAARRLGVDLCTFDEDQRASLRGPPSP